MKDNQYILQHEIVDKAKINVVTCGDCGDVFFHRMSDEELECPHCGIRHDPSDCPDFYYEHYVSPQQLKRYES